MTGMISATGQTRSRLVSRSPIYYGWVNVFIAGIAMTATLPGRTHGLSLVTEPLLEDLGFDRVTFAHINLAATLIGASFAFFAGWLVDRIGVRMTSVIVGISLAASVFTLSWTTTVVAFLVALTLIRGFGQSALSVVSMAMVGKWFDRRLSMAMAVFSVLITIGFIATTIGLGELVSATAGPIVGEPPRYEHPSEWRTAWNAVGWWILLGFVPLAWLLVRNTPERCGLLPDPPLREKPHDSAKDYSLRQAMLTPAFWVFVTTSAFFNVVWSGIVLFNESIAQEQGFNQGLAVQVLAILTFGGMFANFVCGAIAKRSRLGYLFGFSMGLLGVALAVFPLIKSTPLLQTYAVALGIAGGFVTVLFFAIWGDLFGRTHLGRIQGSAQMIATLASAVGPLIVASSKEYLGSYHPAFWGMGAVAIVLAMACVVVPIPPERNVTAP